MIIKTENPMGLPLPADIEELIKEKTLQAAQKIVDGNGEVLVKLDFLPPGKVGEAGKAIIKVVLLDACGAYHDVY